MKVTLTQVLATLMLLAPFVQSLFGIDLGTAIPLVEVIIGSGLAIFERYSISSFNWTSSTLYAVLIALATSLSAAGGVDFGGDVLPHINEAITAVMALFTLLGINNARLKK
jgi:uncharacterized membrane protein